jgi:hypothetical protein
MTEQSKFVATTELFEATLTHADDRIRLSAWIPPQWDVIPRIRGKHWFNTLWLLPLGVLFLIVGAAVAHEAARCQRVRPSLRDGATLGYEP